MGQPWSAEPERRTVEQQIILECDYLAGYGDGIHCNPLAMLAAWSERH